MTDWAIPKLVLAGLLIGSPACAQTGTLPTWDIVVDGNRIELTAENAPTREIVLAISEEFDIRLVEYAQIEGTISAASTTGPLHNVLAQLLENHSYQLFAAAKPQEERRSGIPNTLFIFSSGSSQTVSATAFLESALLDGDRNEKAEAIRELGRLRSTAALQTLSLGLTDDDPKIRELALETLETIDDPEAMAAIASASLDTDPRVRAAAAEALASGDARNARLYLVRALTDPDARVRQAIIESLAEAPPGRLSDDTVVAALDQALADDDPDVRMAAVDALESVDGAIAFQALMRAKLDNDERIAESAEEALVLRNR